MPMPLRPLPLQPVPPPRTQGRARLHSMGRMLRLKGDFPPRLLKIRI